MRIDVMGGRTASESANIQADVVSGGRELGRWTLDGLHRRLDVTVTPSAETAYIRFESVPEPGEVSLVRFSWRPVPSARLAGAAYVPSINLDERPPAAEVNAIVVHATVIDSLEGTVGWFQTYHSRVSAHYVVGRDGKIVQMVDDNERAWHAGVSELEGVSRVNDFSIGIEIVNLNDGKQPFTDAQYAAVASIIRHIRRQYSVPDSRIVSHAQVARPVGRKSDPVGFDFPRLLRLSRSE